VGAEVVHLDDEALVWPEEVDGVGADLLLGSGAE
jgi:hypothetical protein